MDLVLKTYDNHEAQKDDVGKKVSWLREPWRSNLQLASICVQEVRIE